MSLVYGSKTAYAITPQAWRVSSLKTIFGIIISANFVFYGTETFLHREIFHPSEAMKLNFNIFFLYLFPFSSIRISGRKESFQVVSICRILFFVVGLSREGFRWEQDMSWTYIRLEKAFESSSVWNKYVLSSSAEDSWSLWRNLSRIKLWQGYDWRHSWKGKNDESNGHTKGFYLYAFDISNILFVSVFNIFFKYEDKNVKQL